MSNIIPMVEGLGDIEAVPTLLYNILHDLQQWQWHVGRPYRAKSLDALKKNLSSLLWNASAEKNCRAILIALDLDDGCPVDSVEKLAQEIRALNLAQPVAIVFAHREYEAWFLASLPTIAGHHGLPSDVVYEGDVERKRDVKGWLRKQMPRRKYTYPAKSDNPIPHQKQFTSLIDLELAYDCLRPAPLENSRSFRRLYDAVAELLEAAEKGERGYVSPQQLSAGRETE